MLSQPKKGRGRAAPLKELGEHPKSGDQINIMNGPYGPYIKSGKTNVSLPEGTKPEDMTLPQAIALLAEKGDAPTKKKGGRAGRSARA